MTDAAAEIIELHEFFEAWFGGKLPSDNAAFARFDNALAPGFAMVSPSGAVMGRQEVLDAVRTGHANELDLKIWIRNITPRSSVGLTLVVTYEEWQQSGDSEPIGRISSVVFERD